MFTKAFFRSLFFAVTTLCLLSACKPNEEPSATSQVTPTEAPETVVYEWWAGDTPAGETVFRRAGDGRITNETFVHWNNREYRVNSELQLDADGLVTAQTLSGTSPFGAPLNESFALSDGQARWQTTGETGSAKAGDARFYLSIEWGASAALEALVRAASKRLNGELGLYPAGTARVEKQLSVPVATPSGEAVLDLYAIHGVNFQPVLAWFDQDLRLAVRDIGRMGMLPQGWDRSVIIELGRVQAEQAALLIEQASGRVKHTLDRPVLIGNVDVVDVERGELLPQRFVLIENGLIQSVSEQAPELADAQQIDGSGQTLIPGLWDMHSHHGLEDGVLNIAAGVTSVRNLGATHERVMEQVAKFDSGQVIGPRTWRGAMIDQVGPYANRNPVASVEEALAKIDEFADQGYMQIKLYSSIDPAWVPAIAERAHQRGLLLSGHVPAFMSAEQAVNAGYDEIQHINMVFLNFLVGDRGDTRQQIRFTTFGSEGGKLDLDSAEVTAFIDLLRDNKVVVDPTAAIFDEMMRHVAGEPNPTLAAVAGYLPPSVQRELLVPSFEIGAARRDDWAATAVRLGEMVRKLHESGVQLVAGTDAMAGFALHRELELYVQYGIPEAEVLKIATLDSARIVGADAQTGSIAPGKWADLVLLRGNPLEDISAIRRASWVFKGDTTFRPDELYATVGVKPFGYSSGE